MDPNHFPVRLRELRGLAEIEEMNPAGEIFGGVNVSALELNHPGGCAGFRFETRAFSIAYLPDHEPFQRSDFGRELLLRAVRGCDLLILDTQYDEEEFAQRHGWGHGSLTESVAFALDAGVKQLVLFHHDPSHSDEKIDAMLATARELVRARGGTLEISGAQESQPIQLRAPEVAAATR